MQTASGIGFGYESFKQIGSYCMLYLTLIFQIL